VPLPGDEGWDYSPSNRWSSPLIAHGTRVQVIDTDKLAVAGEITHTPGVHGIALAPDLGRGYISAGRSGVIVVFDLETLLRAPQEIKTTGDNPRTPSSTTRQTTACSRSTGGAQRDRRRCKDRRSHSATIALDAKPAVRGLGPARAAST